MAFLCIRNGRVIDPWGGRDEARDLWFDDGNIMPDGFVAPKADEEIDAAGMLVMPGFVDVHVHLREPGKEEAETLETGCAAALAGGFTAIACMPNTTPCMDTPEVAAEVLKKAGALNGPEVVAWCAATVGREGRQLVDLQALQNVAAGKPMPIMGFTDDGAGVEDEALCRELAIFCEKHSYALAEHCEFNRLSAGGVMHSDYAVEAETAMIARDLRLAEETGAHVHLQHLSCAHSVELIREAKERDVRVTAEVTPHHLTLTDQDAIKGGTNFKMNPPLRTEADRQALVQGLRDGTIDMIATDHAPHTPDSKAKSFADAAFGVIGMETAASVIWTRLVKPGMLTPLEMADRMSRAPKRHFCSGWGYLQTSFNADMVIFDPNFEWTVDPEEFKSGSRNCPFNGWDLEGRVRYTIVKGEVKYCADVH